MLDRGPTPDQVIETMYHTGFDMQCRYDSSLVLESTEIFI
jgi:L-serine deaminase